MTTIIRGVDLDLYPYDWTQAARKALNLPGGLTAEQASLMSQNLLRRGYEGRFQNRYVREERREGVLPNGMSVRLLPSTSTGKRGRASFTHRLQVRCFCGRWIPAGRMEQHFPRHRCCRRHRGDCDMNLELGMACWLSEHLRKNVPVGIKEAAAEERAKKT